MTATQPRPRPNATPGDSAAVRSRPAAHDARAARRALVLMAVILSTQLMVVLDGTVVNVALPSMQRSLGLSTVSLSWVVSGYTLAFGGLLLFGARCGDLLGRRRTFLAGLIVFLVGSLAGGLAHTGWVLLAARGLQGVGGAFAAPATLALITALYPEGPERVRAIGLFTAVSVGGAAAGLAVGGLLLDVASWRWVFFINLPIGVVVVAAARVVLPETPRASGRFDVIGAVTSTLGMGGVVYGFISSATAGWASVTTLTAFALGIALLVLFVRTELRAEQPILPLRLLNNRTRNAANGARGLLFAGAYGFFFFLIQFLQDVRGYSALRTGLAFLPLPLSLFASSQLTSRVLLARLPAKPLMLTGLTLSLTATLLDSRLSQHGGYLPVLVSLMMFGAGNGISAVTLTGAALVNVEQRDVGAASGLVNAMQQLGPAIGVAVLATVFAGATAHATAAAISHAEFTRGVDHVFVASTLFILAALAMVVAGIPRVLRRPVTAG